MSDAKATKTRTTPRVALNALADYLTAAAGRRRSIVADQKRPRAFRVAYYSEAEAAIVSTLASDRREGRYLDEAARRLRSLDAPRKWDRERRDTGLAAIEAFRTVMTAGTLARVDSLRRAANRPRLLTVSGLQVSVRPELVLEPDDQPPTGALKIYLSKGEALSEERARYAATVLHQYVSDVLGGNGRAEPDLCYVLDVFAGKLFSAPRRFQRRRQDIAAACAEFLAVWRDV
jgi:hypothetical protein